MSRINGWFERSSPSWRIVVEVLIRPSDQPMRWEQARAVVDTGANRTAITAALAKSLQLPSRGKKNVISARGMNMHALFDFNIGFVTGDEDGKTFVFVDGMVQGMEWGGHDEFGVLLGMDILSRCDLTARRDRSYSLTLP